MNLNFVRLLIVSKAPIFYYNCLQELSSTTISCDTWFTESWKLDSLTTAVN